jgi:hypothetical protein
MHIVSNPFQACNDIFFKPNGVFKAIGEKQNWSWIPFFILMIMAVVPGYLYINFVDFDFYVDLIINNQYANSSPAEQQMIRDNMNPSQIQLFMIVASIIGFIIINAILALYLNFATKSDENNLNGYTDWYGFTWWASMPIVLNSALAMLIIALADDHQIGPEALNPTSIGYLLNIAMDSPWYTLSQSIRLESFWTMYLISVGVAQWTNFSNKKAILVAVAPYVIIWLVWLLFIIF